MFIIYQFGPPHIHTRFFFPCLNLCVYVCVCKWMKCGGERGGGEGVSETPGQPVWRRRDGRLCDGSSILIKSRGEGWLDLTHYPNVVIKAWGWREQEPQTWTCTHTQYTQYTQYKAHRARADVEDAGCRQAIRLRRLILPHRRYHTLEMSLLKPEMSNGV